MIYDSSLSREASLSEVLDEFLTSETSPEIVVQWLSQYEDDFAEIIKSSRCYQRMFQLDWFFRCKQPQIDWLLSHMKKVPTKTAAYFAWQICKAESQVADNLKYRFRGEFEWIFSYGPKHHPYNSFLSKSIVPFDMMFFKAAKDNQICDISYSVKNDVFGEMIYYLNYSLFRDRMLQIDFFQNLNEMKKFFFIKAAAKINIINRYRFDLQLFDSDESSAVKLAYLKRLQADSQDIEFYSHTLQSKFHHYELLEIAADKTPEMVEAILTSCKDKSYSELMLQMTINSRIQHDKVILYLLMTKNYHILKDWLEFDREDLVKSLDCAELVEYLCENELEENNKDFSESAVQ